MTAEIRSTTDIAAYWAGRPGGATSSSKGSQLLCMETWVVLVCVACGWRQNSTLLAGSGRSLESDSIQAYGSSYNRNTLLSCIAENECASIFLRVISGLQTPRLYTAVHLPVLCFKLCCWRVSTQPLTAHNDKSIWWTLCQKPEYLAATASLWVHVLLVLKSQRYSSRASVRPRTFRLTNVFSHSLL